MSSATPPPKPREVVEVERQKTAERTLLVATLEAERTVVLVDRDPGYEHCKLSDFPDIPWWRYHARFRPLRVLEGAWSHNQDVRVVTRGLTASSPDTRWFLVLAAAPKGPTRLHSALAVQRDRIIHPESGHEIGRIDEADEALRRYVRTAGLVKPDAAPANGAHRAPIR